MSLQSIAQELTVISPEMDPDMGGSIELVPLKIFPKSENPLEVHEEFYDVEPHEHEHEHELEVSDIDADADLHVSELPGAPEGTILEIIEEQPKSEDQNKDDDDNDAKSKKPEKWDWASKGPHGFVVWIKERIDSVPKHSGYDSAGLERAISYLEKLDTEISKAMRMDLEGELDANKVEKVRSEIDDGINRLHDRIDKVKQTKKRKKKSDFEEYKMVKEAQKITGIQGVYVTVPLLISGIARVCINSMVSAGHDIESVYKDQIKKYNLNDREKSEVRWLLFDMGYTMRGDRGFMPEEDFDSSSSDNYDYGANYKG